MTSTATAALHTPGQQVTDYTRRAASLQVGEAINSPYRYDRVAITAITVTAAQDLRIDGLELGSGNPTTIYLHPEDRVTVRWERTASAAPTCDGDHWMRTTSGKFMWATEAECIVHGANAEL